MPEILFLCVASGGSRAYIAFSGGLDVPVVMGSKATLMRNKLGGVEGRKLEKGDRIGFCCPRTTLPNMEMRRMEPEVFPQGDITLRVVTGPQDSAFTEEEVRKFFWYSAVITNESDRMGIRAGKRRTSEAYQRWKYTDRRRGVRLHSGAYQWTGHYHDGGSADDRWLYEDRNRYFGGSA